MRKNSRSPRSVLAQFFVAATPSHRRLAYRLRKLREVTRSSQRPVRAGRRDWHNACGNCGNPRHDPPARYRDRIEGRAERSETHSSGPVAVRKYSRVATGRESGATVVLLEDSPAVWQANGNWRTSWVIRCTISRLGRGEAPRATGKIPIFSVRESRKPRPMVLAYSGLLRPEF